MDSANRGKRKTERENVRLCYKILTHKKKSSSPKVWEAMLHRHGTTYQRPRATQNRNIVASLFPLVATLFQHYNDVLRSNRHCTTYRVTYSPLGHQWIEYSGLCKKLIPFTSLIFFQIHFPLPESYPLTQNSEMIIILYMPAQIFFTRMLRNRNSPILLLLKKKKINLEKKRQQRYLAVTLNAVRRGKCF